MISGIITWAALGWSTVVNWLAGLALLVLS